jgi:hypothetical protein
MHNEVILFETKFKAKKQVSAIQKWNQPSYIVLAICT